MERFLKILILFLQRIVNLNTCIPNKINNLWETPLGFSSCLGLLLDNVDVLFVFCWHITIFSEVFCLLKGIINTIWYQKDILRTKSI